MQIDNDIIKTVVRLTSNDNKMLLLNGRYYCELTSSQETREVPGNYCFFSEAWKEKNSSTLTQCSDCYVLDSCAGNGHHTHQFGKIYHFMHLDLNSDAFSFMLSDNKALINVVSIEVIDKPYPIKRFMEMLDKDILPKDYMPGDGDPMLSLDGVAFVDFGKFDGKSASMEYYIDGKLYFEVVDFKDMPDMGIVQLDDTSRREVVVNMQMLNDDNAKSIADVISARIKALKQAV